MATDNPEFENDPLTGFDARTAELARTGADDALLRECRWEAFRASGPGGQKRNKTSSAIRLTHMATGISAIANESRQQSVNRARAMERLRHRMTIMLRLAIDPEAFAPPSWFTKKTPGHGRFRVVYRRGVDLAALGLILDTLAATQWSVADAARLLGISTSALTGAMSEDPAAWAEINRRRTALGLRTLKC
jgi:hypothetical protein